MSETQLLIARKVATEPAELTPVLRRLQQKIGLDPYTTRQRLLGRGLALLAKGRPEQLDTLAGELTPLGLNLVRLTPTPPRFEPQRLTALRRSADAIHFALGEKQLSLERGQTVVAILADLSGALIDKSLKQLMVQNAYRGADAVEPISDQEVYRTILRAKPVLDLYLLGDNGKPRGAVRVFPGRYDPKGLGERMSYSGAGNLEALLELVRELAGQFTLHSNFGLDLLPGCKLKTGGNELPFSQDNLASLTRYGWLMLDLAAAAPQPTPTPTPVSLLAATGVVELSELAGELAQQPPPPPSSPKRPDLPPPPELAEETGLTPRKLLSFAGAAFGFILYLGLEGYPGLLSGLFQVGFSSGALPALGAIVCGWGGVHYLRLKRTMENTPTSRSRSVAMGMVEIQGRAVRRYAVVSPMTHLACVYWRLQKFRRDRNDQWKSVGVSSSGPVPFELEDGTGRITIDPRGASIRCRQRQEGFPGQMSLLFSGSGSSDMQEKWVEEVLCEGTSLYVLGFASAPSSQGGTLRQRTLERLRQLKTDPQALSQYDSDGDGHISQSEWDAARQAEEERALHESLQQSQNSSPGRVRPQIGRPPQRGLPFLIAESASEAHLSRNYAWYAGPLLLAGLGFAIWTLWVWTGLFFPA